MKNKALITLGLLALSSIASVSAQTYAPGSGNTGVTTGTTNGATGIATSTGNGVLAVQVTPTLTLKLRKRIAIAINGGTAGAGGFTSNSLFGGWFPTTTSKFTVTDDGVVADVTAVAGLNATVASGAAAFGTAGMPNAGSILVGDPFLVSGAVYTNVDNVTFTKPNFSSTVAADRFVGPGSGSTSAWGICRLFKNPANITLNNATATDTINVNSTPAATPTGVIPFIMAVYAYRTNTADTLAAANIDPTDPAGDYTLNATFSANVP